MIKMMLNHEQYMKMALQEAEKAFEIKEVPIGAVVVEKNQVIGKGHNMVETLQDPTAHAEMIAISAAANTKGSWRLNECSIYVTVEPCTMCIGGILLARFAQLIFGTRDASMGACGSVIDVAAREKLNHTVDVAEGVLAQDCAALMRDFFVLLREKSKNKQD